MIRTGIIEREFELYYQPIIDGRTETLCGAEALLRWPTQGISPDIFIPIAEDSKTIGELGKFVMEEAFSQLKHWENLICEEFTMSINLSPVQLLDDSLVFYVKNRLPALKIPAHRIQFELTETALLDHDKRIYKSIRGINEAGIMLALDDFGTGFSSISHLLRFPLDAVKIDKSIIPNGENTKAMSIFRGLVSMIDSLGLVIVAEGIELESHIEICRRLSVSKSQGYFWDKPLTPEDFELKWLKRDA